MALVGLLVGAAQLVVALIAVIGVASKPHPCSRSHNHRLQGQFWLPQLNTRGGIHMTYTALVIGVAQLLVAVVALIINRRR